MGQGLGGSQPLSLGPDQQTGDQTLALLRDVIKLRQTEVIAGLRHLEMLLNVSASVSPRKGEKPERRM